MTHIELWNTPARRLELFAPIRPNEVGIYTCGPTVYSYAHLGNFRAYLFADSLRRSFEYLGFAVRHVMNITDVGHLTGDVDEGEDKVELAARREGKSAWEIASFYTEAFLDDAAKLNILKPQVIARATAHIAEQIALIKELEAKGFTYRIDDGIYFDTSKFSGYGPLTGQPLEELEVGARVEPNPQKRHPFDFALWKLSNPVRPDTLSERSESNGSPAQSANRSFDSAQDDINRPRRQMEWESPWGVGFPGWHIECSAMSAKYLGQPFDIHTGGVDHIFPHHSNERAQSEAATGQPLANYWLHNAFMTVDGKRMGKSEGNTYTLQDLIDRGFEPLAFRYFALGTHYRHPLNFTWEALKSADQALKNLRAVIRELPLDGREHSRSVRSGAKDSSGVEEAEGHLDDELEEQFRALIAHDLGAPQALALFWDVLKSDRRPEEKAAVVKRWDQFFGLNLAQVLGQSAEIPAEIANLVSAREQARGERNFTRADELRAEIETQGYTVDDTPEGPKVRRLEHSTDL